MKNGYRKCFKIIYDYTGCVYTDQDGRIPGKKTNDGAILSGLGSFIGIICYMRISVKTDESGEIH